MTKLNVAVLIVCVMAVSVTGSSGASAHAVSAPAGLTSYGRTVWNLDALLHDRFGHRPVYLSIPQSFPRSPRNFSTISGGLPGQSGPGRARYP